MSGLDTKKITVIYQKKNDVGTHKVPSYKDVEITFETKSYEQKKKVRIGVYRGEPVYDQITYTAYNHFIKLSKEVTDLQRQGYQVSVPVKQIEKVIKEKFPNEWCTSTFDERINSGSSFECHGIAVKGQKIKFDYSKYSDGRAHWERSGRIEEQCNFVDLDLVFGETNNGDVSITTSRRAGFFNSEKQKNYKIIIATE